MAQAQAAKKLYTLTEVAKKTNISMPTLQRYKKLYQDRIPSEGQGRLQRYPEEALDVFRELKAENVKRRGRPRKSAAAKSAKAPAKRKRKTAAKKAASAKSGKGKGKGGEELLTLTQIGKLTGISYPTLLRYVKTHLGKIPHKGTGRARRYKPEAVEVFNTLRSQSRRGRKAKAKPAAGKPRAKAAAKRTAAPRRGRPPKSADSSKLAARIDQLEKTQKKLVRELARVQKKLGKPIKVVWR